VPSVELSPDVTLHYELVGGGPPLVLLYGAGGDHTCWAPQIKGLADRHTLILPDLRGTGATTAPVDGWSIATYAEDVSALIDHLELEAVDVAGMSLGGAVTLELLLLRPDVVRAAVVMNTWGRTDARLRAVWGHTGFLGELRQLADELPQLDPDRHDEDLVELNLALFFSPWTLEHDRASAEAWWAVYTAGMQAEGAAEQFRSLLGHNVLDRAGSISAPVLVLAGEEDYFTPHYSRELSAALPNGTLRMLEGPRAAHGMHWERAADVNRELTEFLAGASSAEAA
jgi:pimeloyl-ACP methyl ester carboxylesterase